VEVNANEEGEPRLVLVGFGRGGQGSADRCFPPWQLRLSPLRTERRSTWLRRIAQEARCTICDRPRLLSPPDSRNRPLERLPGGRRNLALWATARFAARSRSPRALSWASGRCSSPVSAKKPLSWTASPSTASIRCSRISVSHRRSPALGLKPDAGNVLGPAPRLDFTDLKGQRPSARDRSLVRAATIF